MSIDFRDQSLFNEQIQKKLSEIRGVVLANKKIEIENLDELHNLLLEYYKKNNDKEITIEEAKSKTKSTFSQFLQHFVCFCVRHLQVKINPVTTANIDFLINDELFYNYDGKTLTQWVDPKYGHTAVNLVLEDSDKIYPDNIEKFLEFITRPDRKGNSLLYLAFFYGHLGLVEKILFTVKNRLEGNPERLEAFLSKREEAGALFKVTLDKSDPKECQTAFDIVDKVFNGKKNVNFKAFFTQEMDENFSPVADAVYVGNYNRAKIFLKNAREVFCEDKKAHISYLQKKAHENRTALSYAIQSGDVERVKIILDEVDSIAGGKNTDIFRSFLTDEKFFPLNQACKEGKPRVLEYLLEVGKEAYGCRHEAGVDIYTEKYINDYFGYTDTKGYSLLNTSEVSSCVEVMEVLLKEGERIFGGRHTEKFKKFLNYQFNQRNTPLSGACYFLKTNHADPNYSERVKKRIKIIQLLVQYGADPDIANDQGFSARSNIPLEYDYLLEFSTCKQNQEKKNDEGDIKYPSKNNSNFSGFNSSHFSKPCKSGRNYQYSQEDFANNSSDNREVAQYGYAKNYSDYRNDRNTNSSNRNLSGKLKSKVKYFADGKNKAEQKENLPQKRKEITRNTEGGDDDQQKNKKVKR